MVTCGEFFWVFGGHLVSDNELFEEEILADLLRVRVEGRSAGTAKVQMQKISYNGAQVHLANHSASMIGRRLMVLFGGGTYDRSEASNERVLSSSIFCYSIEQNFMYEVKCPRKDFVQRGYHSCVNYEKENRLIIYGGLSDDDKYLSDIVVLQYKLRNEPHQRPINVEVAKEKMPPQENRTSKLKRISKKKEE